MSTISELTGGFPSVGMNATSKTHAEKNLTKLGENRAKDLEKA